VTFLNFFGSGDPVPRRVATGRNTLRAALVRRAEQWPWCSLARWLRGSAVDKKLLAPWPLPRKPGWVDHVNSPLTATGPASMREARDTVRGRVLDRSGGARVGTGVDSSAAGKAEKGSKPDTFVSSLKPVRFEIAS
jgi:hypothetical protein